MAGCRSGTEAEMLKDGLSSTQVIGFLAYGELSFTQLIQEPFFHALSCWGLTLHSKTSKDHTRPDAEKEEKKDMGIRTWIKGHATKD
jgi:hypothetical protein